MRLEFKKSPETILFEHLLKMANEHHIPLHKLAKEMVCHVIESDLEKEEKT